MADVVDRRPGGGGAKAQDVKYVDIDGDESSFAEAIASLAYAWDGSSAWEKVESTSNALNVHLLSSASEVGGASAVDDAAFAVGTDSGAPAMYLADETAPDSVDEGDVGVARMTLDRRAFSVPSPHTSGGLSFFNDLDLDETAVAVKASAGQIYGWSISNENATNARYVQIFNVAAGSVTVGTTTPDMVLKIPAASGSNFNPGGIGIAFGTAITVAATTGISDAGAPGASEVVCNIFYK